VDLHAHARTFLGDVLDALDLDAVDIAANSMGGWWSAVFAIGAPERVSRLALVGAPPGVNRTVPLPLRLFGIPLVAPRLARRLLANPTPESSRSFWGRILVAHPERLDDELIAVDVAHMRRNSASVVGLMTSAIGPLGIRRRGILGDGWLKLRVPTVFIRGERDAFVTSGVRRAWEEIEVRNPNLRIVSVPGAGHLPWLDEPEPVLAEIERLLAPRR
jgi:pimeloyl-ACP methyl ester carboxylesterase